MADKPKYPWSEYQKMALGALDASRTARGRRGMPAHGEAYVEALHDFMQIQMEKGVHPLDASSAWHSLEVNLIPSMVSGKDAAGNVEFDYGDVFDRRMEVALREGVDKISLQHQADKLESELLDPKHAAQGSDNRARIAWDNARGGHEYWERSLGREPISWPRWEEVDLQTREKIRKLVSRQKATAPGPTGEQVWRTWDRRVDSLAGWHLNTKLERLAKRESKRIAKRPTRELWRSERGAVYDAMEQEGLPDLEDIGDERLSELRGPGGRKAQTEAARAEIAAGKAMAAEANLAADEAAAGGTQEGFAERMREWYAKNKGILGGEEGAVTFGGDKPDKAEQLRETLRRIIAGDKDLESFHRVSPARAQLMLEGLEGVTGDPLARSAPSVARAREFMAAHPDVTPDIASSGFRSRLRQFMADRPDLFNEEGAAEFSRRSFLKRLAAGAAAAKGLAGAKLPAAGGPRAAPLAQGLADVPPNAPEYFPRNAFGHPLSAPRNQAGTPWGESWRDFAGLYPAGNAPPNEALQRQWAEWHWRNTAPTGIGGNLPEGHGAWSTERLGGPRRDAHVAAHERDLLARLFSEHPAAKERAASEAAWALNEARIKAEWAAEDARRIRDAAGAPDPEPPPERLALDAPAQPESRWAREAAGRAPARTRNVFTGEPVPVPQRISMPVGPEAAAAQGVPQLTGRQAARSIAAKGAGALAMPLIDFALDPEARTWDQFWRQQEDLVTMLPGLTPREKHYTLPPDRERAVEATQGALMAPNYEEEPVSLDELNTYLTTPGRFGEYDEHMPEWVWRMNMEQENAGQRPATEVGVIPSVVPLVTPKRAPARAWETPPSGERRAPSSRAWAGPLE